MQVVGVSWMGGGDGTVSSSSHHAKEHTASQALLEHRAVKFPHMHYTVSLKM